MKVLSEMRICERKGRVVYLQEIEPTGTGDIFCVQYSGNGSYFKTYGEAVRYLQKRKFAKAVFDVER